MVNRVPTTGDGLAETKERNALPLSILAGLILAAAATSGRAATVVSLEFDDAKVSQSQLRALLGARGMKATFFVNSNRIGASGYLTAAQLHDLQNDGHEIAGHTLDHLDLTTLSAAEAERQVCDDRAALIAAGFEVRNFAYPFGAQNASVKSMVAGCGYLSARTVGGVGCAGCAYAEAIPPADPFVTATRPSVKSDTTLAVLQTWVTEAEAHGGGWVQIVMHDVCDGCSTYSLSPTILAAFLDWLAARAASGTVVKPVREAMGSAPPPQDTTPPETAISCSPRGCSEWSNRPVTVTLTAVDEGSGVAEILYTTDGTEPGGPSGQSCGGNPCSFTVPVSATVKYRAVDLAGNVEATKSQPIRIDTQSPEVAITSPGDFSLVLGTVTVKANAGDNVGIARVSFFVDGRLIGTTTTAPYQVQWQSGSDGIGLHSLQAEAADLAGNITDSAPVTVIVGLGL